MLRKSLLVNLFSENLNTGTVQFWRVSSARQVVPADYNPTMQFIERCCSATNHAAQWHLGRWTP